MNCLYGIIKVDGKKINIKCGFKYVKIDNCQMKILNSDLILDGPFGIRVYPLNTFTKNQCSFCFNIDNIVENTLSRIIINDIKILNNVYCNVSMTSIFIVDKNLIIYPNVKNFLGRRINGYIYDKYNYELLKVVDGKKIKRVISDTLLVD